ncbi:hypothetical protein CEXT_605241 [Caerostris extrusa]|uniref:Uncharacterized protein n=1 Tax=Caerostris extrusa TaxID=172846 RepID=A0AAV4Q559_CAEEX|nr:hypothetical protein CEXT_605241 [Caerostris extrusa]
MPTHPHIHVRQRAIGRERRRKGGRQKRQRGWGGVVNGTFWEEAAAEASCDKVSADWLRKGCRTRAVRSVVEHECLLCRDGMQLNEIGGGEMREEEESKVSGMRFVEVTFGKVMLIRNNDRFPLAHPR